MVFELHDDSTINEFRIDVLLRRVFVYTEKKKRILREKKGKGNWEEETYKYN